MIFDSLLGNNEVTCIRFPFNKGAILKNLCVSQLCIAIIKQLPYEEVTDLTYGDVSRLQHILAELFVGERDHISRNSFIFLIKIFNI
jgi:hypothetical protein